MSNSHRTAQTYNYVTLDNAEHTRLLTLLPGRLSDPIECQLEHVSLVCSPYYQALSYSWGMNEDGDASLCRAVQIDGCPKAVTKNLFEAFVRIRNSASSVKLWVDAICINQDDDHERSSQVANMATIYAQAAGTIIWLGESVEDNEDANTMSLLSCLQCFEVASFHGDHDHREHSWVTSNQELHSLCCLQHPKKRHTLASDDSSTIEYAALQAVVREALDILAGLTRRRWFRRLWIVQEVLHSNPRTSMFLLGLHKFNLPTFASATGGLKRLLRIEGMASCIASACGPERMQRLKFVAGIGDQMFRMRELSTSLPDLLETCSKYECSDDRDRLYALISIDKDLGVRPNYSLSTGETYTMFARKLVEASRADIVLKNACTLERSHKAIDIPSWVPDLRGDFKNLEEHIEVDATVSQDNILSYTAHLCGIVDSVHYEDGACTAFLSATPNLNGRRVSGASFALHIPRSQHELKVGDVLCSLTPDLNVPNRSCHVLRPYEIGGQTRDSYRLTATFLGMSTTITTKCSLELPPKRLVHLV